MIDKGRYLFVLRRIDKMLICLFLFFNLNAQQKFEIEGSFLLDGATVILLSNDSAFHPITTTVINGRFRIIGRISQENEYATLRIEKEGRFIAMKSFFIAPCKMQINIFKKSCLDEYKYAYSNVPFVEAQQKYDSVLEDMEKEQDKVFDELSKDKALKLGKRDSILSRLKKINDTIISTKIDFIKSNKSYYGLHLLRKEILNDVNAQIRLNPDSLYRMFSSFDNQIKSTRLGRSIKTELEKRIDLSVGNEMPTFLFKDSSLKAYSLKELLKEKYVLLGFWFAGCAPCKKSFPIIKLLERKYEKDLMVITVSVDKDEKTWETALQKYNVPGVNTLNLEKYVLQDIESLYNIKYSPQYFLIDRSGKLIYHNIQSGDTDDYSVLKQTLAKLLN